MMCILSPGQKAITADTIDNSTFDLQPILKDN